MAAGLTTTQAAQQIIPLPTGGYVTIDPDYDLPQEPPVENVGIVRWHDQNGMLLSYIQGSTANDQVGSGGITVMNEWYIAVSSPLWDNAGVADAGAVTIISPQFSPGPPITTVSATNSMVGSSPGDQVGSGGVALIHEWSMVVCSPLWDNAGVANAGALTLMNPPGAGSVSNGAVSASNSLVGSSADDQIGSGGVTVLDGGAGAAVRSPSWDNGGAADAGAVTLLGLPELGLATSGAVSATNSLVGASTGDQVGSGGITLMENDVSVLVHSPLWDNSGAADAGAVTILGLPGIGVASYGTVSASNSLVGSSAGDQVGSGGISVMNLACILIHSPLWDNSGMANAGAVTLISTPGHGVAVNGTVSAANSLVGSSPGDQVGSGGAIVVNEITMLVCSPLWDNSGAADTGAVTILAMPGLGLASNGTVSASNSLVGSTAGDQVGSGGAIVVNEMTMLVCSPLWDNSGAADTGALTLLAMPGVGLASNGTVSATNSLVGSTAGDQVGSGGLIVMNELNVLVRSPLWDNSGVADAGAVTILAMPGLGLASNGAVSASNSLVGSSTGDQVGSGGVTVLDVMSIMVSSPLWDNGGATDAGAVTIMAVPGAGLATNGVVSPSNSLVGSTTGDQVGSGGVTVTNEWGILVFSPLWDNGGAANAGAVTNVGHPSFGLVTTGAITAANSLVGSSADDQVGSGGMTLAEDLGYVILSPLWDRGSTANAGAVTMWTLAGSPHTLFGVVSATNSLVGASAHDQVGSGGATVLMSPATPSVPQGFAVRSPLWDNGSVADAGALTLGGFLWDLPSLVGTVSASNSLVGASTGDDVGSGGIILHGLGALVLSPLWDNGTAGDAGAATLFAFGVVPPTVGVVSSANSLVGSSPNDRVGSGGVTTLGIFGLAIHSPLWDNGTAVEAGAVTVINGPTGPTPLAGVVSSANSLVGSSANDQLGSGGITVLGGSNEGFVLRSPLWDRGLVADAGAVTVVTPVFYRGTVSADNSMVGSSANDQVGGGGIARSGADSFVVVSPQWDNGAVVNVGAATFGRLHAPFQGSVSSVNSIVGSAANDQVGSGGVWAASSTVCLVHSPLWDHRTAIDAGAVTWMSDFAAAGPVTLSNSFMGSHSNDQIGSGGITVQQTSPVVIIRSPNWCYGAGAITHISTVPLTGTVNRVNSMTGMENAEPELALLQPAPVEVTAGSTQAFGNVRVGGSNLLTFTIKNKGTDDLVLYNLGNAIVTLTGMDASQFSLVGDAPWLSPFSFPLLVLVAGDSASFSVRFSPTSRGVKTTTLSLYTFLSPVASTAFSVSLTGTGEGVPVADWRQTHFGSSTNTGDGADHADYDKDGISNLVEYALGLNPTRSTAGQMPAPVRSGGNFTLSFTESGSAASIIYGAEWSSSLVGGSWQPVADTGTPPQHVFSVPIAGNTRMYMRLKVTAEPPP